MGRLREFFTFSKKADFVLSFESSDSNSVFSSDPVETAPVSIDEYFRRLNDNEEIAPVISRRTAAPGLLPG
jgi:hypothetical protein